MGAGGGGGGTLPSIPASSGEGGPGSGGDAGPGQSTPLPQWQCSSCTLVNNWLDSVCASCSSRRPSTVFVAASALPSQSWTCSMCSLGNPVSAVTCTGCGALCPTGKSAGAAVSRGPSPLRSRGGGGSAVGAVEGAGRAHEVEGERGSAHGTSSPSPPRTRRPAAWVCPNCDSVNAPWVPTYCRACFEAPQPDPERSRQKLAPLEWSCTRCSAANREWDWFCHSCAPPPGEPWICDSCGSANSPFRSSRCSAARCYKKRPEHPRASHRQPEKTTWSCPKCAAANGSVDYVCKACPPYVPPPWTCTKCTFVNDWQTIICTVCSTGFRPM